MDAQTNTLFVILARGGSKRLPHKNLLEVGGVPLIGRAVRNAVWAATLLGQSPKVIVSTDDEAIATTARKWGARTPFVRPAHLADDNATSRDALLHAVEAMEAAGERFGAVVLMQPTSPLALPCDIVRAVRGHREHPGDSVVTVRRATDEDDATVCHFVADGLIAVDGDERVALNGAAYVCSPPWLREEMGFCLPGRTRAIVMPGDRSVDVDTQVDLLSAQTLWRGQLPWQRDRYSIVASLAVGGVSTPGAAERDIAAVAAAGADAVRLAAACGESEKVGKWESVERLRDRCRREGLKCLIDATGVEAVDRLDGIDADALVVCGEALGAPGVVRRAAATGRPLILAAGGQDAARLDEAVGALRAALCTDWAIMQSSESVAAAARLVECAFDSDAFPAFVKRIRGLDAGVDSGSDSSCADTREA